MPAAVPQPPGGPGGDFITVDDGGFFEYQPTAAAVELRSEYPSETECIVDRLGNNYTLGKRDDGGLRLRPSLGRADFPWLRRAWARIQSEHPDQYPIIRRAPESDALFLQMLFEVLPLTGERPTAAATRDAVWSMRLEDQDLRFGSLQEIGRALARAANPSGVVVSDPYGHHYRPEPRKRRQLGLLASRYLVFVEP